MSEENSSHNTSPNSQRCFAPSDEIEPDEENVSRGIRQTLNHWALEPTTAHLNQYRDEKGDNVANEAADL